MFSAKTYGLQLFFLLQRNVVVTARFSCNVILLYIYIFFSYFKYPCSLLDKVTILAMEEFGFQVLGYFIEVLPDFIDLFNHFFWNAKIVEKKACVIEAESPTVNVNNLHPTWYFF